MISFLWLIPAFLAGGVVTIAAIYLRGAQAEELAGKDLLYANDDLWRRYRPSPKRRWTDHNLREDLWW